MESHCTKSSKPISKGGRNMVRFVIGMFLGLAATVGVKAAEKAVEKK